MPAHLEPLSLLALGCNQLRIFFLNPTKLTRPEASSTNPPGIGRPWYGDRINSGGSIMVRSSRLNTDILFSGEVEL